MSGLPFLEPRLFDTEQGVEHATPGEPLRLAASHCPRCDRTDFPRRAACPACYGVTSDVALADGTLARFTSVLHPPPGAQVETPYHLGVAAFDGGISVLGQLLVDDTDQVAIGDAVIVVGTEVDGTVMYAFRPV